MRTALVMIAATCALPVLAEGRHDPVLDCAFEQDHFVLFQDGGDYQIEARGVRYPATVSASSPDRSVLAVFAMLDAGPLTIVLSLAAGSGRTHEASATVSAISGTGLATQTAKGACTEATS